MYYNYSFVDVYIVYMFMVILIPYILIDQQ